MVGIFLFIVALCAVAKGVEVDNEWIKSKLLPGKINTNTRRVTGGQNATLGQFPYQALLLLKDSLDNELLCGGSIISQNWILTAAHCLYQIVSARVYVGIVDLKAIPYALKFKIKQKHIIMHEKYDVSQTKNDIGLIRLTRKIPENKHVNFISLPTRAEANENLVGKIGLISGFGLYSDESNDFSRNLRWVEVPIVSNIVCEKRYSKIYYIRESNICSQTNGGKSICSGDSGGPLSLMGSDGKPVLFGIVSFGSHSGCENDEPFVFTRVHSFLDWIEAKSGIKIS